MIIRYNLKNKKLKKIMWSSLHHHQKEKEIAFATGLLVGAGYSVTAPQNSVSNPSQSKRCHHRHHPNENNETEKPPVEPVEPIKPICANGKLACMYWDQMLDKNVLVCVDTEQQCMDILNENRMLYLSSTTVSSHQ